MHSYGASSRVVPYLCLTSSPASWLHREKDLWNLKRIQTALSSEFPKALWGLMGKGTPGALCLSKLEHMFQNSGEPTQAALSKVSWYGCWNTGTYCMAKVYIIHLVPWSSINFSKVRNRWHCITDITFPPPLLSCKQENKTNTRSSYSVSYSVPLRDPCQLYWLCSTWEFNCVKRKSATGWSGKFSGYFYFWLIPQ